VSVTQEHLMQMAPDKLHQLHDKFTLIGVILGKLALLDVVTDPNAVSTAKAQAGKTLTQIGESPQTITERLKESQFADMSPDELRTLIMKLKTGEMSVDQLLEED